MPAHRRAHAPRELGGSHVLIGGGDEDVAGNGERVVRLLRPGRGHERVRQPAEGAEVLLHRPQPLLKRLGRVTELLDVRLAGHEFLGAGLQHGRQQCLPRGEVPVQGAGTDARLLGHRLEGGADPVLQEVTLRGLQEGCAVALDVRAGLACPLLTGAHVPSCLP